MDELLTPLEHETAQTLGAVAGDIKRIIGEGPQANHDWGEAAHHIHVLQRMIMSQAAARAFPGSFRLLGKDFSGK